MRKFGFILRQAQDEVACFQRLSPHGELVEPWATSFFSILLEFAGVQAKASAPRSRS
jgi:hypothetical protein